jgi:hypothetical protein
VRQRIEEEDAFDDAQAFDKAISIEHARRWEKEAHDDDVV